MGLLRCITAGFLTLAFALSAKASGVIPGDPSAGTIPNITVWDEAGHQSLLRTKLEAAGSGPVFVLPVYTHCTMSCPVLASRLVAETAQLGAGTRFRVLIFSFDPADDAAALREFRAQEKLPASWVIVRSSDLDIRRFTDFFHYRVLTEGGVMLHTNQMFLMNQDFVWRATFVNESWSAADIRTWLKRVQSPGIVGWAMMNPATIVYAGLGGMLLSLGLALAAMLSRTAPAARRNA